MPPDWIVTFSRDAIKQYKKLKRSGSKKPSIIDIVDLLAQELALLGPHLAKWSNYSPLGKQAFHCHLKKGQPTYVACWKVVDKSTKHIEVYYVGTHEAAPY